MAWQSVPEPALPPALRDDNPWGLPRRVDGGRWGERPPLDGVLVADFSRVLAGPLATMTLADLGAEVVKVERPGTGDDTRHWGPPWTDHASSYFECVNRSKRSIALDLRDRDDLSLARELAARADVVVENFLTGTMDRLRARATTPWPRPTRGSSTARSPASAAAPAPRCRATTSWCRRSAG